MNRRKVARVVCLLFILLAPGGAAAERRIAVLIDTSGSMVKNDPRRYTVQVSKVLSDLLEVEDQLTVIRLPRVLREPLPSECSDGPRSSLGLGLNPRDRAGFKRGLDGHIGYEGGNFFASPVRTAAEFLSGGSGPRLLLMLADAGGFAPCDTELTSVVRSLAARGVFLAALNLGRGSTFDRSKGFRISEYVGDASQLIRAVAEVYQEFIGAKQVQTGPSSNMQLEIDPYVQRAFLVVAADGPIAGILQPDGNPDASNVDLDYRGGGSTLGLDRVSRGYKIVRLEQPKPGTWRFRLDGATSGAWMLVQESAVGVRLVSPGEIVRGEPSPVQVELYDVRDGRRIEDLSSLPGLRVEATLGGRSVRFRDDGTGGDRTAGDGILTTEHVFEREGDHALEVRVESDRLEQTQVLTVRPGEANWVLEPRSPARGEAGQPVELRAQLRAQGPEATLRPPDRIEVRSRAGSVELRDDGHDADRAASDGIYTGRFTPHDVGKLSLRYEAVGGSRADPAVGSLEVFLVRARWLLEPRSPERAEAGAAVELRAALRPDGPSDRLQRPERIEVRVDTELSTLRDDGTAGDAAAGDLLYTGSLTPSRVGRLQLRYEAVGGSETVAADGSLEVAGRLEFGAPIPVRLDDAHGASEVLGALDLSTAKVAGTYDLEVTSDFGAPRSALEILSAGSWLPLATGPARIRLDSASARTFPLRLRVADCPVSVTREQAFRVVVTVASGAALQVPLSVRVVPDSWLHCWWPVLAAVAGFAFAAFVVYGFWSPSRFPPRVGLVLSPEEDLSEGFFHPIRAQQGTGAGFYRDARVYVLPEYRLSGHSRGALACIRADGGQLRIRPVGGLELFKQTADGDWEPLIMEESPARLGVVFKNEMESLFFELRSG